MQYDISWAFRKSWHSLDSLPAILVNFSYFHAALSCKYFQDPSPQLFGLSCELHQLQLRNYQRDYPE